MAPVEARRRIAAQTGQVVVKVGTNAICDQDGRVDLKAVRNLAKQIAELVAAGRGVVLVASGAIGAGVGELGLPGRPKTIPGLQGAAAIGQGQLMRTFHDVFGRHGLKVAQVLLTRDDFADRTRYLNIRNTLTTLGDWGVLPIVNENDTVAVDEIRFGDNDVLAALLANMVAADLVIFLTSVDGVMKGGKVLDAISCVDEQTMALVTGQRSKFGVGGMSTKLEAARLVTAAGELAVIANADEPNVLKRILDGEKLGTIFLPAGRKLSPRQRWIAQASRTAGKIIIDDGAAEALAKRGKSLLPSGVCAVAGKFAKGAVVAVIDAAGRQVARGLTNYSSTQLELIKGLKTNQIAKALGDKPYDAVIHRNNMTIE